MVSELNGSSSIQDGNGEGLLQFLDYVVAKGYGPATAVGPWRSAVKQVVAAVDRTDDIGAIDIRALDVESILIGSDDRAGRVQGRVDPGLSEAVRTGGGGISRLHRHREAPNVPGGVAASKNGEAASGPRYHGVCGTASAARGDGLAPVDGPSRERMIDYPFPLRSGSVATLRLPARLEKADAERLASFMRTLVFEPVLELTMGSSKEEEASS